MPKKIITIALLPVFMFSIIGWQWMFALRIYAHQVKEWSSYADDDLEIITVSANEKGHDTFQVNDHELFHHGKYFDIKFKKRRGDEIIFYCHPDTEEEGIYASFANQIKVVSGIFSPNKKIQKVVKLSVFDEDHGKILFDQEEVCEIDFLFNTLLRLNVHQNSVFVPPDQGVLFS